MKAHNFSPMIFVTTAMPNKFDNFGAIVATGLK